MKPKLLITVLYLLIEGHAVQGEPCRKLLDRGFFGQGTSDRPAPYSQGGGPYTMMDSDGAAELPTGYLYRIDWFQSFPGNFTFQIFRPVEPQNRIYVVIYQREMQSKRMGEVAEFELDRMIAVEQRDHFGFTYNGAGSVPINYRLGNSDPAPWKPYQALECPTDNPGCGTVPTYGLVRFGSQPVYKQFQLRVAARVYRYVEDCGGAPPDIVNPATTKTKVTGITSVPPTVCAVQCPAGPPGLQGAPGPPGPAGSEGSGRKKREVEEHSVKTSNKQTFVNAFAFVWMAIMSCIMGLHVLYTCKVAAKTNKQAI